MPWIYSREAIPYFFERDYGREPLFILFRGRISALLGAAPFALRLTSAVVGALTMPAVYWMVREALAETGDRHSGPLFDRPVRHLFLLAHNLQPARLPTAILVPLVASLACAWFWGGLAPAGAELSLAGAALVRRLCRGQPVRVSRGGRSFLCSSSRWPLQVR